MGIMTMHEHHCLSRTATIMTMRELGFIITDLSQRNKILYSTDQQFSVRAWLGVIQLQVYAAFENNVNQRLFGNKERCIYFP